jgi:hypothetical protein
MGQTVSVTAQGMDAHCVFTTDRVLTGQDGVRFETSEEAEAGTGFPAVLAARLFSADEAIESVWIASSEVIVGRGGGWDGDATAAAQTTITDLYRFYD